MFEEIVQLRMNIIGIKIYLIYSINGSMLIQFGRKLDVYLNWGMTFLAIMSAKKIILHRCLEIWFIIWVQCWFSLGANRIFIWIEGWHFYSNNVREENYFPTMSRDLVHYLRSMLIQSRCQLDFYLNWGMTFFSNSSLGANWIFFWVERWRF